MLILNLDLEYHWVCHGNSLLSKMAIIIIRTFIKRHKSRNIHSEALYMSTYTKLHV